MYEVKNKKGEVVGYKMSKRVYSGHGENKVITVYSSKSLNECQAKLKQAIDEFERARRQEKGYVFSPDDLFKDFAVYWYDVYVAHADISDATKKNKWYQMDKLISEFGDKPLNKITSDACQMYIYQFEGYSKTFLKNIRNTGREIFKKALSQGLVESNPMEDIIFPKTTTAKKRALTEQERIMILRHAKGHEMEPIILLMYYCGMRPKEVRYLEWDGIDFDKKIVTVGESKTENGRGRRIPMSKELKKALTVHRLKHPTGKYVFPSNHSINEPMTERMLSDKWNAFKKELDIENGAKTRDGIIIESTLAPDLTMYIFRHTFASDCQAAGVPINVAKEFMGHADISTTAQTYTHMIDDVFNNNRRLLENKSKERIKQIQDKHSHSKIIKIQ